MLFMYAKLPSRLLTVQKGEREAAHMRETVYLNNIENIPTIKNLYHIQCQYVDWIE